MFARKLLAKLAGNLVEKLETARKLDHFSAFRVNASKLGNGKMWSRSLSLAVHSEAVTRLRICFRLLEPFFRGLMALSRETNRPLPRRNCPAGNKLLHHHMCLFLLHAKSWNTNKENRLKGTYGIVAFLNLFLGFVRIERGLFFTCCWG